MGNTRTVRAATLIVNYSNSIQHTPGMDLRTVDYMVVAAAITIDVVVRR